MHTNGLDAPRKAFASMTRKQYHFELGLPVLHLLSEGSQFAGLLCLGLDGVFRPLLQRKYLPLVSVSALRPNVSRAGISA